MCEKSRPHRSFWLLSLDDRLSKTMMHLIARHRVTESTEKDVTTVLSFFKQHNDGCSADSFVFQSVVVQSIKKKAAVALFSVFSVTRCRAIGCVGVSDLKAGAQ